MTETECSIWYKAVFGLWELIPISGCSRDPPTGAFSLLPNMLNTKCRYFVKFWIALLQRLSTLGMPLFW